MLLNTLISLSMMCYLKNTTGLVMACEMVNPVRSQFGKLLRLPTNSESRPEQGANLPEQPSANRVGSSLVNIITSMSRCGRKPAACNACSAAIPPITPSVPSYAPARGMASVCEPVWTLPTAHCAHRLSRTLAAQTFRAMQCTSLLQQAAAVTSFKLSAVLHLAHLQSRRLPAEPSPASRPKTLPTASSLIDSPASRIRPFTYLHAAAGCVSTTRGV